MKSRIDQPAPTPNERPAVWPLVIEDMRERDQVGRARYGTPLQPFNGRSVLADAYAEALDLAVYLRQEIEERKAIDAVIKAAHHVSLALASEPSQSFSPRLSAELQGLREALKAIGK